MGDVLQLTEIFRDAPELNFAHRQGLIAMHRRQVIEQCGLRRRVVLTHEGRLRWRNRFGRFTQ